MARWSHRLCVGWRSFLGCVVVFHLLGRIPCMFVLRVVCVVVCFGFGYSCSRREQRPSLVLG